MLPGSASLRRACGLAEATPLLLRPAEVVALRQDPRFFHLSGVPTSDFAPQLVGYLYGRAVYEVSLDVERLQDWQRRFEAWVAQQDRERARAIEQQFARWVAQEQAHHHE